MKITYVKFGKVDIFKQLGEIIDQNVSEKEAVNTRANKTYHLTKTSLIKTLYPLIVNFGII